MWKIALVFFGLNATILGVLNAQDFEIYLQGENSDPISFAALSVVDSDEFYISDQNGRLILPQSLVGKEVKITHLALRDTTLSLEPPFPKTIHLNYEFKDLAGVDVTPINEKKLFESAIEKLEKDIWTQPSVNMGYFQVQLLDEKQALIDVKQAFGVYIFQELLDRSRGNNEWILGGFNGFYRQEERNFRRSDFGDYFPNPAVNSLYLKEIFGYLNDVFVLISKWKVKEAFESYASNNQYYYVFKYNEDGYDFLVHVDEESEQVHHIEITSLRNPGKRNRIQFSGPSYFRIDFGYDGQQAFIANLDYRGNPINNPECELFIGMEITKRGVAWSLEPNVDLENFFQLVFNRDVNYNPDFWNHPSTVNRLSKGISADLMDVPFEENAIRSSSDNGKSTQNTENLSDEELERIKIREEYRKIRSDFTKYMESKLSEIGALFIIPTR